jgi:uncharacterized membrane protein
MKTANRLLYLDWVRGLAAVIMLQGHVFHSFLKDDLRSDGPYVFSQFLGGMPPALFLFLTGITLAFLMDSQERKNLPVLQRWTGAFRRSGYLFTVAFAFRIQLWLFTKWFSPQTDAPWSELLKVDVLNCMGFGIAALAVLAMVPTRHRTWAATAVGAAIAFVSPLVTQAGFAQTPMLLRDYLVPNANFFSFFPWAAFIAFGLALGSALRSFPKERMMNLMRGLALAGIGMAFGANLLHSHGPALYAKSDFWVDGPALVFIKLGVVLLLISFAYAWLSHAPAQSWSWIRQLGTTSLLVYWVHIELVYGHWLGWMKNNLTVTETLVASVVIIGAMVAISYIRSSWPQWKQTIGTMGTPAPQRVSGD